MFARWRCLSAAQHVGRVPLALAVAPWRCLACLAVATWQHIASPRALAYCAEAEHVIVGVWHATRGVEAHPTPTTRMTTERNGGFYQGRTAPHRTCCHAQRNVAQQRVCLRLQGMTQVDKASKTWTRSRMRCVQAYSTWHIADECPQWCHTPHSARRARYFAAACAHNDCTFSRQPKNSTILAGKPFTGGAAQERTWRANDLNNHPRVCGRLRALCCAANWRQSITDSAWQQENRLWHHAARREVQRSLGS